MKRAKRKICRNKRRHVVSFVRGECLSVASRNKIHSRKKSVHSPAEPQHKSFFYKYMMSKSSIFICLQVSVFEEIFTHTLAATRIISILYRNLLSIHKKIFQQFFKDFHSNRLDSIFPGY